MERRRARQGRHAALAGAVLAIALMAGGPATADEGSGHDDVAQWPGWARTDGAEEHEEHGGHGGHAAPAPDRPRALVLGSFAAVNGAVLLAAAVLRRRTRGEVARRREARSAALRGTPRPPAGTSAGTQ